MARRRPALVHGVLAVNKPLGVTSRAVVNRAMYLFGERRCGHAGTLDPDASGVLVLAFGRATKVIRWLTDGHKTYLADVRFGTATHTDDAQGDALRNAPLPSPWSMASLDTAAQRDVGGMIAQVPPAVSALKFEGVRDYERVHRGETIARAARPVRLDAVRTISIAAPEARFEVDCGPGFYVRAWARDLGEHLESAAHLYGLKRLRSSGFSIEDCIDLDSVEPLSLAERHALLVPLETAVGRTLPVLVVDAAATVALVDGKRPAAPAGAEACDAALVLGPDGQAICVASVAQGEEGLVLKVVRGLREDGAPAFRALVAAANAVEPGFSP